MSQQSLLAALLGRLPDRSQTTATVHSVNDDGTVTVRWQESLVESLPALASYTNRAAGDQVVMERRPGQLVVIGRPAAATSAAEAVSVVYGASDPPVGEGWLASAATGIWVKDNALYVKLASAPPPPSTGTLEVPVAQLATYDERYGPGIKRMDRAEQGSWTGTGPNTGIFTYGAGAWSALSGATSMTGVLRLHRMNEGGVTGGAEVRVWLHNYATPPGTVPTYATGPLGIVLARNETGDLELPASWLEQLRDGTAAGFGVYGPQNAELDQATAIITYA